MTGSVEPQTFVLGTLSYKNGIGFIDGDIPGRIGAAYTSELKVSSSSSTTTPFNFNQFLIEQIRLDITYNYLLVDGLISHDITPEQEADILYFPNRPELGSFRIYENSTGTVEFLGRFGSLELAGFGNAISGGFVYPTIDPNAPTISVPESGNIAGLLAIGIVGAASTLKRKLKPSQSSEKETTKVT
ncbi:MULTISPECIES: choice-of-anchor K domain-containing protein [unclassified Microcystis]|uniref:choice-of-anchor K domain-containing protein n=1 Tax=unclassified Microcystis TaxID=2643300 RepID=UPI0025896870|nr:MULTISPECIES: choice-of-anchor K domain-containing protein [unclassified Microcystis]